MPDQTSLRNALFSTILRLEQAAVDHGESRSAAPRNEAYIAQTRATLNGIETQLTSQLEQCIGPGIWSGSSFPKCGKCKRQVISFDEALRRYPRKRGWAGVCLSWFMLHGKQFRSYICINCSSERELRLPDECAILPRCTCNSLTLPEEWRKRKGSAWFEDSAFFGGYGINNVYPTKLSATGFLCQPCAAQLCDSLERVQQIQGMEAPSSAGISLPTILDLVMLLEWLRDRRKEIKPKS